MTKNKSFALYSLLAFPLAFIGLPIYVHIANFYNQKFELSIITIGILLFVCRFIDTIQDPFIGFFSDKLIRKKITRKIIILFSSPFLALSFYFLFNPSEGLSQNGLALWFLFSLIFTYTFFSIITINYNALGAEISEDYNQRNKVTSIRESVALMGILIAAISPTLIGFLLKISDNDSFFYITLIYAPILFIFSLLIYLFLPTPLIIINQGSTKILADLKSVLNKDFLILAGIFLINCIAVSLPASTFLFFVQDVLKEEQKSGIFLLLYFLSGALGMPIWNYLAKVIGKKNSWIISIIISIIIFFWAFFLKENNYQEFYLICFLSGIALGADLSIPPSILADLIAKNSANQKTSIYFGIWNMISKLGLAVAGGGSLLILGFAGYKTSSAAMFDPIFALSFSYAILPCLLKIMVIILLLTSKIDKKSL